jgi:hypothetical protein
LFVANQEAFAAEREGNCFDASDGVVGLFD